MYECNKYTICFWHNGAGLFSVRFIEIQSFEPVGHKKRKLWVYSTQIWHYLRSIYKSDKERLRLRPLDKFRLRWWLGSIHLDMYSLCNDPVEKPTCHAILSGPQLPTIIVPPRLPSYSKACGHGYSVLNHLDLRTSVESSPIEVF